MSFSITTRSITRRTLPHGCAWHSAKSLRTCRGKRNYSREWCQLPRRDRKKRREAAVSPGLGEAETLVAGASSDVDDTSRHTAFNRARISHRNVLRVHAALRAENVLIAGVGAWLCKGNKIAAFISVTLHDIILPFWPAIVPVGVRMGMWVCAWPRPATARVSHVVTLVITWNGRRS